MIPPAGWYVEIDSATATNPLTPGVAGDPQIRPSLLNDGLPEVRVPVKQDDKWQADAFDEAPARVWLDGDKQPVEELDAVTVQQDTSVLICQGGRELLQRVQLNVDDRRIHTLLEDLISDNTSYTPNVDVPRADSEQSQIQFADTQSEFDTQLPDIPADKPISFSGGVLEPLQTATVLEAEQFGPSAGGIAVNSNASDGEEAILDGGSVGQYLEFVRTPAYDIPQGEALPLLRLRATGPDPPGFEVTVNGTQVYSILSGGFGFESLTWLFEDTAGLNGTPPAVSAGTDATVRIEITETGSDDINVDLGGVADGRYNYTFDNDNGGNGGYLTGPEEYPQAITQEFSAVTTSDALTGATCTLEPSPVAELAFSIDNGATFPYTASDTDTLSATFDSLTTTLITRATFGRTGTGRSETPTSGYNAQGINIFELTGTLSTIPIVVDERYDDTLLSVIQDLLRKGDMLGEYRDDGTTKTIEVAQPGQRVSDRSPTIANYEVTKRTTTYQRAVVEGAGVDIEAEQVTADHGTAVTLANSPLVPGKERVTDGSGTVYTRGDDYTMDYEGGAVTALSGGAITDGETLAIDYRYKIVGSYTVDGVSSPNRVFREDIPGLTTQRAADQAARILARDLNTPRYEATVSVPPSEAGFSLIDDLPLPEVPTQGQTFKLESTETSPTDIRLQLGSGETPQQAVNDIRNQLASVSGRI